MFSANRFLKEHIDDLCSGANEIAAKFKHFNHRRPKPSLHTLEEKSAQYSAQCSADQYSPDFANKDSKLPQEPHVKINLDSKICYAKKHI